MKFALVFAAVLAVSAAQFKGFGSLPRSTARPVTASPLAYKPVVANRVSTNDQAAEVTRLENDINPDGSYSYIVEINNGIAAQAQGAPRDFGGNPPIVPIVSKGAYSWISPEGVPVSINYVADENGYQPTGDAIPTPHPIPEAILRSLEFISKNQKK